jgi:threonyl-tRNA synthetase
VLVIGEREVAEGTVTLRRYGSREQRTMPLAQFIALTTAAIAGRSDRVFEEA